MKTELISSCGSELGVSKMINLDFIFLPKQVHGRNGGILQ